MTDEAFVLHLLDDAELLVFGDQGIDAVQLPQVDALDAKSAYRHLHALAQVLRPPDRPPRIRSLTSEPTLRRDDHTAVGIARVARVQCLTQEVLADEGAVGVGGVDEVDAEIDCLTDHPDGDVVIRGIAPDAGSGDAHGAEAESVDGQGVRRAHGELAGGVHGLGHEAIPSWRRGA